MFAVFIQKVFHVPEKIERTRAKRKIDNLEASGPAEILQSFRTIGDRVAGCIKPIPVLVKQPEIKATGSRNSDVDDPFKFEKPMDLKERALGIHQMLQKMVEPNHIKKAVREFGVGKFPMAHVRLQRPCLLDSARARLNAVNIPTPLEDLDVASCTINPTFF